MNPLVLTTTVYCRALPGIPYACMTGDRSILGGSGYFRAHGHRLREVDMLPTSSRHVPRMLLLKISAAVLRV